MASDIVTYFEMNYSGHPLVGELKGALGGGSNARWALAVERYRHGAFDKVFQTGPAGTIAVTALAYCFTASVDSDRADLLGTISNFRIVVNRNIPSFLSLIHI